MRSLLSLVLAMAIAFGRSGNANSATPATPLVVTVTINAGETGVLVFGSGAAASGNLGAVTSITGGGTWTLQGARSITAAGFASSEVWATGAGAAAGATSVSIAFSGSPASICAVVAAYTGVLGLGVTGTATGATNTPTISVSTQDANNYIVGGMSDDSGATFPAGGSGTLRDSTFATSGIDNATGLKDNTAASASSVTVSTGAYGFSVNWVIRALELRSVSAVPVAPPRIARIMAPQQRMG